MFFTPMWNWLKLQSQTAKQRRRRLRNAQGRPRLFLEPLEDRTLLTAWVPIGPAPIVNGQTAGSLPVSGRVTAIAADPGNANTVYVASAGGGIWKTTNANNSSPNWTPLTDNVTDGSGNPIPEFMGAVAETDATSGAHSGSQIVYAGTGEANNGIDAFYGKGILVSTNGGSTWTLTTGPSNAFNGQTVEKIVLDPSDTSGGTAYAVIDGFGTDGKNGNTGIWKTTNFGANWTNMTVANTGPFGANANVDEWSDLVIDPHTPSTIYAAIGTYVGANFGFTADNGIYKSTDGGSTWSLLSNGPTGSGNNLVGRISLAIYDDGTTNELLASVAQNTVNGTGGLLDMVLSKDGGTSFATLTNTPDYLNPQGWYDTTLGIDPTNPNYFYAAGIMAHQGDPTFSGSPVESFNAGASWTNIATIAGIGPHTDSHGLAFDANGNVLEGDDGGIFRLNNPTNTLSQTWSDLNGNLSITQFTGIAVDPTNGNVIGGSQDNGTEKYTDSTAWTRIQFGDGGMVRLDPTNDQIIYTETANGGLFVSTNGGSNFTFVGSNLFGNKVNFYGPYVLDSAGNVYYGTDDLLFSSNHGAIFSSIGTPGVNNFNPGDAAIDAVAVAPGTNNVVYVSAGGHMFVSKNAQSSATWTEIDLPNGSSTNGIGDFGQDAIAVDPSDATGGTAYAVVPAFTGGSKHVYKTTTFGVSWTDISGNLPDTPCNAVTVSPDGKTVYVGTDVGVYSTSNGGTTWSLLGTGLPFVKVTDLEDVPSLNILAAGTHGRGMWEIPTVAAPVVTSITPTSGPASGGTSVTINGSGFTGATAVDFGSTVVNTFTINSDNKITVTSPAGSGKVDVTVVGLGGTSTTSANDQFTYVAAGTPIISSVSPNSGSTNGHNLVILNGSGFTGTTAAYFGGVRAGYSVVSDTEIKVFAPPQSAGTVDVTVVNAVGTSVTGANDQYTYLASGAPTVTAINPSSGPLAGTNSVTISGSGFSGATAVFFGGNAATGFTVNSPTSITATVPAGTVGTVDVTVTTPVGVSATKPADQYTYVAAPTVTGVNPSSGSVGGNNTVTISGTGFSGATAVFFGGNAATSFTVNSPTSITAVVPASTGDAAGTVDVTVTTAGGTSGTSAADQYTYGVLIPSITSVSPSSGYVGGGTVVTISGIGFTGATAVKFGSNSAASFTVVNDNTISATAPAGSLGTVDVTVTAPGGNSTTGVSDDFTYVAAGIPIITSVSPNSGSTNGHNLVILYGSGFTGATKVYFGGVRAGYFVVSDNEIKVFAPPQSAGTVDVTVVNAVGTSLTGANDRYTYY
jgi:hypothetical protein